MNLSTTLTQVGLLASALGPTRVLAQTFVSEPCRVIQVNTVFAQMAEVTSCLCELQGTDLGADNYNLMKLEDMPENWCETQVESGSTMIQANQLMIESGALKLENAASTTIATSTYQAPGGRKLSGRRLTTGSRSVLVIRAEGSDSLNQVTSTAAVLADKIFGTGSDTFNFKSQYLACSYNQLNFSPATPTSATGSVVDGVIEISTTLYPAFNTERSDFVSAIINQAQSAVYFGANIYTLADHIMICLPDGTTEAGNEDWIASSATPSTLDSLSSYNDNYCIFPAITMSNVGKNLGLAASLGAGIVGPPFGDESGLMGYDYSGETDDDGPEMCFNAAKTYQLDWFSTNHVDLDASSPIFWNGILHGFVDQAGGRNLIIRIIDTPRNDYYIHYNKQAGFNSGTAADGDKVMIVAKTGTDGTGTGPSAVRATLVDPDDSFVIADVGGFEMVITLITRDGTSASLNILSTVPSSSPSQMPSFVPSRDPSSSPSLSVVPSSDPSDAPSTSVLPSSNPSSPPSLSSAPSKFPTMHPVVGPTKEPTRFGFGKGDFGKGVPGFQDGIRDWIQNGKGFGNRPGGGDGFPGTGGGFWDNDGDGGGFWNNRPSNGFNFGDGFNGGGFNSGGDGLGGFNGFGSNSGSETGSDTTGGSNSLFWSGSQSNEDSENNSFGGF